MNASPSPGPAPARRGRRHRGREAWLFVHRWMGLGAGVCLVVIGLTGSLFVFHHEIAEGLEPDLRKVAPRPGGPSDYRPWPEIIASAEAAKPSGSSLRGLTAPERAGSVVRCVFEIPASTPEEEDSVEVCVDPYTARVLGTSRLEEHPIWKICSFLFGLHYSLQIPKVGGLLVGILALVGLLSLVSGLWLWWPGWGRIRSALGVKRNSGSVRFNFDVHRALGFYTAPIVGALLLSGIWMNLNGPFVAVVRWLSPGTDGGSPVLPIPDASPTAPRRSPAEVLTAVFAAQPEGRLNWASLPRETNQSWVVSQVRVNGPTRSAWAERMVSVDPTTGGILRVEDPSTRRTAGDVFLAWQWPLHSGRAFGEPGRWLVLVAGFVPAILYGTGLRVWWARRRASLHRRLAAARPPAASA
ncbi:MAG: PepSY domain-containing protein [Verrucomicrobiales bacterium]|nr:PepSY domain-containing protein [Verrucomicrobiales bacterium]